MTDADSSARRRRRRAHRPAGPPEAGPPADGGAPVAEPAELPVRTERSTHRQPATDSERPAAPATAGKARTARGRRRTASSDLGPESVPAGRAGRDGDRGWRDLIGSSPSQVGVSGALRARDVARPGPEELAAAERDVVMVRRQWQPPADEPVPGAGR